ncbi:ABC transporter permease [Ruania alba]|uniref:ABC-2 type transport system permease protein n=1 Tax=Ruania alba TaxID=648782 RepID=A0A1H5LDH2_9MICO|nr:ABC transporter permease [Ruania alba]SEE74268.1 ABC-2 type transport system permease protein [Ruania alba]
MNTTYLRIELARVGRDLVSLFFIAVLPAFFFVIFGVSMGYGAAAIGNGNASMYTMISMAAFGAVTATTGVGGMAAVERMQGWGRQLGLTPMSDTRYVSVKATVAFTISLIPIALIYLIGAFTQASAPGWVWLASAAIVMLGAAVFSLYGLIVGLLFRSEAAVGAASGALVVLAFLGNIFIPLSGAMLEIARFTPLYGIVGLARYPLTDGALVSMEGVGGNDPLWALLLNVGVWTAIFAVGAVLLVRRGRSRQ